MRLKNRVIDVSRWDSYSFVILILALLFQLLKWRIMPIFLDVYYHLLTAAGFNQAGGWVSRCFWEFAPVGRPQLYPPLLHIIMLFFMKLGMPILIIAKFSQFIMYPLLIFVIWHVIREIFDKRLAFFTIMMLFSIYTFYLTAINTLAATLSLIFCLLSLLFLERDKILTSALLFTLAFYTHTFTPWIFVLFFMFYGIFHKERFRNCLKICILALLLASPIIIYQIVMRKYYVFERNLIENNFIDLYLLHWVIFIFGLAICFRKKGKYYIFVGLFLTFLSLLFFRFTFRYFSFYGIMSAVFMNAVFFSNLYDELKGKYRKIYLVFICILFFILLPNLNIDLLERNNKGNIFAPTQGHKNDLIFRKGIFTLNLLDSSLLNFIFCQSRLIRTHEVTIYYPKLVLEVVDAILKNSNEREIIFTNFPYTGGILSLLSNRATSGAMLSEVRPYRAFDKIAVSKLIIWQKDSLDIENEPVELINRYQLKKIADTKLAFIYKNPRCIYEKQTQSAAISYKLLFILLFLVFVLIVWSMKFNIDKY